MVELAENGITIRATEPIRYYIQYPEHTLHGRTYRVILYKSQMDEVQDKSLCVTTYLWDMSNLFHNQRDFNDDISSWDVSNVIRMNGMFYNNHSFNQNLNHWDVRKVRTMIGMFYNAKAFNSNISDWDISNAEDIAFMFTGASAFNQDLSKWDVENIYDMQDIFRDADSFNQDISNWWNGVLQPSMIKGTLIDYYNNRQEGTRIMIRQIKAELMAVTWHPSRLEDWCLTDDD